MARNTQSASLACPTPARMNEKEDKILERIEAALFVLCRNFAWPFPDRLTNHFVARILSWHERDRGYVVLQGLQRKGYLERVGFVNGTVTMWRVVDPMYPPPSERLVEETEILIKATFPLPEEALPGAMTLTRLIAELKENGVKKKRRRTSAQLRRQFIRMKHEEAIRRKNAR